MEQYRKKTRANFLDYNGGDYFVTICTKNRAHYFGKIQTGQMFLSEIGEFTKLQLNSASEHCENIRILLSVVMPNHIHAIVNLTNDAGSLPMNEGNIMQRSPNPALRADPTCQRHVPTLSRYLSSLKGAVTKFAKSNNLDFGWQKGYFDHCIRGHQDGNRIAEYIENNVARWHDDCFYDR